MVTSARPIVLVSEPHAFENPSPFLPYMWAILKSHWERHGDADAYHWLPPIFFNRDPDALLAPYGGASIDVLGLSCYTWNFRLQCALAERVKRANPGCLVVAGGPEPDYKDPAFFQKYPYIDAIAVKDGEITFSRILEQVLNGARRLDEIPGLYLPAPGGNGHLCTGPAVVPTTFDYSPYIAQRAYYEALREQYRPGFFHATLETNRGCPYACSFCDWGSATMAKLRRFSMERVAAECDWIAEMGVAFAMLADANLGILERDLDIADLICEARAKHGFPRTLYYSAAKNHPDRSIEIAKKFVHAGLCTTHTLAIQHTRPEVLAATDRENISPRKQIEVARALTSGGVPIDVQLILGIPGDTYDLWKNALADLMEWGIHDAYDTYFYSLLPNAPAAEAEFLRTWQVETIDRVLLADTAKAWKIGDPDRVRITKSRIIVGSKTYTRDDWVRMFTYLSHVKALHNGSVTRAIAMYLRLTHNVPYREFYDDLIETFAARVEPAREWFTAIERCYRTMLRDDDAMDRMPIVELPDFEYALDPSRWLFVHIARDVDAFFARLGPHLVDRYPGVANLPSLIAYQRELIILPEYDRRVGKRFRSDLDWVEYFEQARGRTGEDAIPEPAPAPGASVEAIDQTCGEIGYLKQPLAWETKSGDARWIEWITRTVLHRTSDRKQNFQQLRVARPDRVGTGIEAAPAGR
jgi:putative methyltransferase